MTEHGNPCDEAAIDREAKEQLGGGIRNPGNQATPGTPGTGEAICPRCSGTGRVGSGECSDCGGAGRIIEGVSAGP